MSEPSKPSSPRSVLLGLATLAIVAVALELFAFATRFFTDDLYDDREGALVRIDASGFEAVRARLHPVLGWEPRSPGTIPETNCVGEEVAYTSDERGARIYPGYDAGAATVAVTGDSYTRGDEARAEDAYPAQLARLLDVSVVNLGVGGYGPLQALLRLEQRLPLHPRVRVVVLGIMYENVHRMMNGYRPVLYGNTEAFFFKPYMARGRLVTLPSGDRGVEETLARARESFDGDFWARPRHRFPYLRSLLRAYGSDFFLLRKLQKRLRLVGFPEFHLSYRNDEITDALFALLDDYAERARGWGVTPVAVFIPRNRLDLRSVSRLLEEAGDRLPEGLIVGDVGARPGVDWQRFNLMELDGDDPCHPSAYGYGVIAESVASLLPEASVASRR